MTDLNTPTADDVRKALASLLWAHSYDGAHGLMSGEQVAAMVREAEQAILDTFELCPHGTVTDAAVDALRRSLYASGLDWSDAGEEGLTEDKFYQAAEKALTDIAAAREAR